MNLMSQQDMILFKDYDHIVSQQVDYKSNMYVSSQQNFVDLMIQHKTKEIYSVDNARSSKEHVLSKEPSAILIRLLS
jgi:uridine kinase